METYTLKVAGLTRELPICAAGDKLDIAAFIMFSDVEMAVRSAEELLKKAPDFDVIITAESKGIPLAYEAARQSGRGIVPEVAESMTYKEALADSKDRQFVLFPWEEEHGKTLKQAVEGKDLADVGVFIGPEGGFSEGEAQMAAENGAVRVTLGPRILRTETAGPAVLAMLLYQMEL